MLDLLISILIFKNNLELKNIVIIGNSQIKIDDSTVSPLDVIILLKILLMDR